MIREKYGKKYQHWFDVWYGDVRCKQYDPDKHTLAVQVPSKYVYEYLEMYGAADISWAIKEVFKCDVELQYFILKEPTFAEVSAYLQQYSAYDSRKDSYHIRIPDARRRLNDCMRDLLGDRAQWLPGYDRVADWLTDNRGKGLLCVGTPSTGKSFLCQKMLPAILGNGGRPIPRVDAVNLRSRLEELKRERICIIDDLGKEPRKHYGDTDSSFFELCNNAERTGNLLIITTNLSPNIINPAHPDAAFYPDSIERRYGREVLDRLKVITSAVAFEGESMRK